MKKTIGVALSGGIDSLMAAHTLKKSGFHLIGLHFITGFERGKPAMGQAGPDLEMLKKEAAGRMDHIARQLDIPIKIVDLTLPFKKKVVDYFSRTYRRGQTPNPCLVCNPKIKFGHLFEYARKLGAQKLATGHYARIDSAQNGHLRLLKGVDRRKDQSYFLAFLTQAQLSGAMFPLGGRAKADVKAEARDLKLIPVLKTESQDICFIKKGAYADFIVALGGVAENAEGPIVDVDGNRIGQHKGLHRFTVGQRRGINCPAAEPYYVVRIDHQNNRLVVGFKQHLEKPICLVNQINWIRKKPQAAAQMEVRIRYRHQAVPAMVHLLEENRCRVEFETAQPAVTPGQGAVFYKGDEVLGGGFIEPEEDG